jgi:hypothetical protein
MKSIPAVSRIAKSVGRFNAVKISNPADRLIDNQAGFLLSVFPFNSEGVNLDGDGA